MIGWSVLKKIGWHGQYGLLGVVESYDSKTKNFQVLYENGKSETVPHLEIKSLKPIPPEEAPPMRSRPLMIRASNDVPCQPRSRCAGKGKRIARARNASALHSGSSDLGNDGVNKRSKVQNPGGSTAARQAQNRQAQCSPRNN